MAIYQYGEQVPVIDESVYVAETADVIGHVTLERNASVWYQAVLRGDTDHLEIGEGSNIQDGAVLHADPGYPLKVGRDVTVGHQAMLHGCTIGDGSLVGIQAVILNGAVIGKNCLVGAGALVKEGAEFPDNSLIVGAPARVVRELSEEQIAGLAANSASYVERRQQHATKLTRIG
ncbi:gamma carbonic anhydrase family protein [Halomonas urumqiensis]|uniref:Gamma carbonic anhydrase family protein n=1 Tax=Halomonas urumqiensis TaxID=1684789 RepID=A0A2N7UM91_9GAMM|nr:gamma carbonic anhydrase family protein [Halomonas urumqiensis]PMR81555.1 gamma carbonic anhydrase family protein [Halomonas urumqiensis]PTB02191.1 gamma carbonic anhydrase family protein [Halomonas urumqiensis]GHE21651.1 gamma carbonic anhydrase family protein [Halomonas urumqiensis]